MDFSREERAVIARGFREDIKKYGVRSAIINVMDSKSKKVEVRKTVLAQQCRKPGFRKEFEQACDQIWKERSGQRSELKAFRNEILHSITC